MRVAALILLLATTGSALGAPAACQAALMPQDPGAFRPHEDDFSIDFPRTPDASSRLTTNGRERVYMDNEGDQLFLVTVVHYYLRSNASEGMFKERLRNFAVADDAALLSERKVIWAGEPAWEGTLSVGVSEVVVRMAMHRGRLYEAIYQGVAESPHEAAGRKFLDSLHWMDAPPVAKPDGGAPAVGAPLKAEAAVRPAASS